MEARKWPVSKPVTRSMTRGCEENDIGHSAASEDYARSSSLGASTSTSSEAAIRAGGATSASNESSQPRESATDDRPIRPLQPLDSSVSGPERVETMVTLRSQSKPIENHFTATTGKLPIQQPGSSRLPQSHAASSYVPTHSVGDGLHDMTLDRLVSCLHDDALSYYAELPSDVQDDLRSTIAYFEGRFDYRRLPETYRTQLQNTRKTPKESLEEYAARVRKLVSKAFPGMRTLQLEAMTVEYFVGGL